MRQQLEIGSAQFTLPGLLAATQLVVITPAFSQGNGKPAAIDATAQGTSTQLGSTVSVKVIIEHFSTEEERQISLLKDDEFCIDVSTHSVNGTGKAGSG